MDKLELKNTFTRKGRCDVCGKVKMVTKECRDCYYSGFDIDEQIKKLQELKKEITQKDGEMKK